MSCRSLYALKPETEEVLWHFTPYSASGEWMYSQPVVGLGRIFIGDRKGYFHCLDIATGEVLWRRLSSRACNNQVNATGLLVGPRIITGNNDGAMICYDIRSGETIWRQRLDGPIIAGILRMGSDILAAATSLYRIDPNTGEILQKMSFAGRAVSRFVVARRSVIVHLGPDFRNEEAAWGSELAVVRNGRVVVRRACPAITHLGLLRGRPIALAADFASLKIIDPVNGNAMALKRGNMAVPDAEAGCLYGLTSRGVVFAEAIPS